MPRIKLGEFPISHRSASRVSQKQNRPQKIVNSKKKSQKTWRRALGKGGRAEMNAIDRARLILRSGLASAMPHFVVNPFVELLSTPKIDEQLKYFDLHKNRWSVGKMARWHPCNSPQTVTVAWVIFERSPEERKRDRRLCRFVASPLELTKPIGN